MRRRWKKMLFALLLLVPLVVSGQDKAEVKTSEVVDTLVYTVYGMDCPGCERGLEKQVNKIPGVKSSEANWVNQRLEVVVMEDSLIRREDLEFRVNKANFTLVTEKKDQ